MYEPERLLKTADAIAASLHRIADNTEMIAMGIAKVVERCYCGDRLDQHYEEGAVAPGKCLVAACNCETFIPIHLATARIVNQLVHEAKDFNELIAAVTGAGVSPTILSPVSPFKPT